MNAEIDEARRRIIEQLLGKRTWQGYELRGCLSVEEVARRLVPDPEPGRDTVMK